MQHGDAYVLKVGYDGAHYTRLKSEFCSNHFVSCLLLTLKKNNRIRRPYSYHTSSCIGGHDNHDPSVPTKKPAAVLWSSVDCAVDITAVYKLLRA